ncbi:MAG: hypothetical protein K0Q87_4809 [Neobacillus sp.]|jgi:hypothetical protein|nr:hypothetical protein [Neobacillus sp.]
MKRVRGQKNKIDVYDALENKFVMRDTGFPEAAKELGISYKTLITGYYRTGLIKGRYKVNKTGYLPSKTFLRELEEMNKPKKETKRSKAYDNFSERWDEAMKPFRILSKRKKAAV